MGITVDAIRKRIAGTIPHERDEDGRVWVILDTDQDAASKVQDADQPQSDATALISAKDETIATLRDQLEAERQAHAEARRLLMAALERIPPQLEAPSEPQKPPQTVEEEPERQSPGLIGRSGGDRGPGGVECSEGGEKRRKAMNSPDAEGRPRDTDVTREERRYLARNSLVERLGVEPRLAEYLLELRERIEKLEDRLGAP